MNRSHDRSAGLPIKKFKQKPALAPVYCRALSHRRRQGRHRGHLQSWTGAGHDLRHTPVPRLQVLLMPALPAVAA